MLNIKKTTVPVLLLSLIIQCGCASLGAHDRSRENIEYSVDNLIDGNIRLVCGVNCYVTYLQRWEQLKELHDKHEWLDLARKVSEIGYELDLAYYYLGRASEVLKSYDAARTYYDHALASPKCR
jgi:hypothetical protein